MKNDYAWRSSPTDMLSKLGWPDLATRRKDIRLTLFYKIVHGDIAIPTTDILIEADTRTRSQHQYKYRHISTNVDSYKFSYFPRTIRDWNDLTPEVVHSRTVEAFKSSLRPDPRQ